jgi:DNA-binding NarL/FixJ family response regulator
MTLVDERRRHNQGPRALRSVGEPPALTTRELEVLKLRASGYTNAEIAGRLFLVEQTVNNHVQTAYVRLRVHCLVDACRALGWLVVPE